MEGQRLILKDGTTLEDSRAGYSGGYLWLWVVNKTLAEAAWLFLDPAKTDVIRFQYGNMVDRYEHYTRCITLSDGRDGEISVCMTRGNQNVQS